MDSITQQIIDVINNFSKANFKLSKYIDLFLLLKTVPTRVEIELMTLTSSFTLIRLRNTLNGSNTYIEDHVLKTIKKKSRRLARSPRMSCRNMQT